MKLSTSNQLPNSEHAPVELSLCQVESLPSAPPSTRITEEEHVPRPLDGGYNMCNGALAGEVILLGYVDKVNMQLTTTIGFRK